MRAYTPGPWTVEVWPPTIRVVAHVEQEADGRTYGDDVALIGECRNGRHQANARVVAAAPELLEALRQCVACLQALEDLKPLLTATLAGPTTIGNTLAEARAAIAKAEGRG